MNKHILFVIDHLENPSKYTQAELDANKQSARSAAAAYATRSAAARSAAAAYWAVYWAAHYAYADAADAGNAAVDYWIDEYFVITGEDKQTYIDKLGE